MVRYGESLVLIAMVTGVYALRNVVPTFADAIILGIIGVLFIVVGHLRERHASTGTR